MTKPNQYHIGITASRKGLRNPQIVVLHAILEIAYKQGKKRPWLHHGDCVGGDAKAHDIADMLDYQICVHPPIDSTFRAYKEAQDTKPAKEFITRNHDIVDESTVLIGLPDSMFEKTRSGTWATIRYAKHNETPWIIVFPDGSVQTGNGAEDFIPDVWS